MSIYIVVGVLWAAALTYATVTYAQQWLEQTHERVLVRIDSHQVPALAQPVFAQFIFTQTLELPEPVLVKRLEVPLYIPEGGRELRVSLRQNGQELATWQTPTGVSGVVPADLPLVQPTQLVGRFELEFNGSGIEHKDSGVAPRVFTETKDTAYPLGNYRIANNEKEGDIGLTSYEQVTNKEIVAERYNKNASIVIADLLLKLAALFTVFMLPFAIIRSY